MKQDALALARRADRPHRGDPENCLPFAESLFAELVENETPCRIVTYHCRASTLLGAAGGRSGIERDHAFVLFQRGSGGYLAIDATLQDVRGIPRHYAADMERVAGFYAGMMREVSDVRVAKKFNW